MTKFNKKYTIFLFSLFLILGLGFWVAETRAQSITITTPSTLQAGSSYTINWTNSGTSSQFAIYLCRGGSGDTCSNSYRIDSPVTGNSYYWSLSSNLPASSDYRINIYDWGADIGGASAFSNYFTINSSVTLNAPSLSSPSNNSSVTSLLPTLSWGSVSGATVYMWNVLNIDSGTTSSTQITIASGKLNYGQTYNWRVKACTDSSLTICSDWSSEWSFTTSTTTTTSTQWSISLSSNSTNPIVGTSVTLTATANQNIGPTTYVIRIYDGTNQIASCSSGTTCSATVSSSTATTKTYLAKVENYGANDVKATSNNISVVWAQTTSSVSPYSTPAAPANPQPINQGLVATTVNLYWSNTIASGGWYNIYYRKNTDSSWVPISNLTASPYVLSNLSTNTVYNWKVRACNSATLCTDSEIWSFTTGLTSPVAPTPTTGVCDATSFTSSPYDFGIKDGTIANVCGQEQYYKITIPLGQTCNLRWTLQPDANSDYDLYVKWLGGAATRNSYEERSINSKGQRDELFKNNISGTYYAAVYKETGTIGIYSIGVSLTNCTGATQSTPSTTAFDFSISLNQSSGAVAQGSTLTPAPVITLNLISGISQIVNLSFAGHPAVTTVNLASTSCTPACSSVMNISTSSTTPTGSYPITITAAGSGLTKTATYNLTVAASGTTTTPITPSTEVSNQITQLQAQIAQLIAQINQLKTELAALKTGQPSLTWCHIFKINLRYKDTGEEVKALQTALQKQGIFKGTIDSNYGVETLDAVIVFQEKYKTEILTPWKLNRGTGFVGSTTIEKLNQLYGCK